MNWFEGGRRICHLLMGLVVAGGLVIVAITDQPDPEFVTYGPEAPWSVANKPCPQDGHIERLWDYDWGGEERGVTLCFTALDDGTFPVQVADPPPEEIERREQASKDWSAENDARSERGETILLPPPYLQWYYTAAEYSPRFDQYVARRRSEFSIDDEMREAARERQSGALWDERKKVFGEVFPWVSGICIFLWLFTVAVGWIIRGFAGVPHGMDFKPSNSSTTRS